MQNLIKPMGIMNKDFRDLQLHQIDAQLAVWKSVRVPVRPQVGWVRAIREALGMSAAAFARRLGMSHAGVRKLELSEADDAITLASLRKLAEALDCEFHYELVPRTSLAQQLRDQAAHVAGERLSQVSHSMALENQAVQESFHQRQLEQEIKTLLEGSRRDLW